MEEQKSIEKLLKIVGIAVLVAVPVFFLVKKLRSSESPRVEAEDTNIFADELSE